MRSLARSALFWLLYHLQLPALARRLNRRKVTILMFHGFTNREHSGTENCDQKHLHVRKLEEFLDYLSHYHSVISLDEALDSLSGRRTAPDNAVVLTFDDGYRSNHALAFPVLNKFRAPASIFLVTTFVGQDCPLWVDRLEYAFGHTKLPALQGRIAGSEVNLPLRNPSERIKALAQTKRLLKAAPQEALECEVAGIEKMLATELRRADVTPDIYRSLRWEEVREMVAGGLIGIGCHTHTHRILGKCQPATIREELEINRTIIRRETGVDGSLFCYPNGKRADFSDESGRILREMKFKCALITEQGSNTAGADLFTLRRYDVPGSWQLRDFIMTVSGATPLLQRAADWLRGSKPPATTPALAEASCCT